MMKRSRHLTPMLALALGLFAGPALGAGGDANFLFGQKVLSEDVFDDVGVDGQTQLGVAVTLDFEWPVMLAIDLLSSSDDDTQAVAAAFPLQFDTDVETTELDLGVRKFWRDSFLLKPYVGGGLAWVQLDAEQIESGTLGPGVPFSTVIVDDDDSGIGFWVSGGFVYRVADHLNLGIDVRYSDSDADLTPTQGGPDVGLDSGGTHYSILLGYHW